MKKTTLLLLFFAFFSKINYVFASQKASLLPIDSCAEMTTMDNKTVSIRIIKILEEKIVFKLCNDNKDALPRHLDLKNVKTIKVANASQKEIDKLQKYINEADIPSNDSEEQGTLEINRTQNSNKEGAFSGKYGYLAFTSFVVYLVAFFSGLYTLGYVFFFLALALGIYAYVLRKRRK